MGHSSIPKTRGRFLTTYRFALDPYTAYRNWKKRFGETFMVRALNGDVFATCNQENIRRVFAARTTEVRPFAIDTIRPLIGDHSLFVQHSETHHRERKLLSPSFYGPRISDQAEVIRDIAMQAAAKWEPGKTIRILDSSLDVSLEVIIKVVFGVQSEARVEQFMSAIKQFVGAFHPSLAFTRLFQRSLFGLSPWNKFVAARARFHELLDEEITRRKNESLDQKCMLSRLMHSTYEDGNQVAHDGIRDQLVTMLLAGHETTQIAIGWGMSWLHRTPVVLDDLREELRANDSVEGILDSELLEGVCNESLRINPVISDVARTLIEPMSWVDCDLPVGTNLAVAICLVHEDETIYDEPLEFRPDRWRNAKFKPNQFLPFGGGVRRCIGATLAMLEMKIVLATWIKHFRFELPEDIPDREPTHRRNITMAPKTGIPLVYRGPIGERG